MRLIDADALMEELLTENQKCIISTGHELTMNMIVSFIRNQPTAFDVKKVVEQLESEKRYGSKYDSYYEENLYRGEMFENDVNNKTVDRAIDIVKKGGVE